MISINHWVFNQETGELSGDGTKVRLPEQQIRALMLLVSAGQNAVVSREKFISTLWPDGRVVEYDQSLNTCIRKLRKALSDNAEEPQFIETIPGKGYRLLVSPEQINLGRVVPGSPLPVSYKSAGSHHLKRLLFAGVISLILIIIALILMIQSRQDKELVDFSTPPKRLIVLPFDAGASANQLIAVTSNAIREALLMQLTTVPAEELIIISGDSVFNWRGQKQLHRNSDYLLSAMIQEDPLNIQLFYRLNKADGQLLWSQSETWLKGTGIKQQDIVVEKLLAGLGETLQLPENIIARFRQQTLQLTSTHSDSEFNEAIYLAGQKTASGDLKAIDILENLVAVNPQHIDAMIWLASLYQRSGSTDISSRDEAFDVAMSWVNKGLRLRPDSAELHRIKAYVAFYGKWQVDVARESIKKAVSMAPNNAEIRSLQAAISLVSGDTDIAVEQAKLAQSLDPLAMMINADLCWYLNFAGLHKTALAECHRTLDLQPSAAWIRLGLIEAQLKAAQWQSALNTLHVLLQKESVNVSNPKDIFLETFLTWIQQLEQGYSSGKIDPYMLAAMYAQINRKTTAIQWLEQAKNDRSGFFIFAKVDSRFDSLKGLNDYESLTTTLD